MKLELLRDRHIHCLHHVKKIGRWPHILPCLSNFRSACFNLEWDGTTAVGVKAGVFIAGSMP
jgi:hypothetical protein